MRTRFGWTALCGYCVLLSTPIAALAASESSPAQDGFSLDRRVLTLLVLGCVVGIIAGWVNGGPRETRLRLYKKTKPTDLSVIVPAGPAPRLIPSDSPNAIRTRKTRAPV